MWIKRVDVLDYFKNGFGGGFSVDNIKQSCESLCVYLSPKVIESWLIQKAKENGVDISKAGEVFWVKSLGEIDANLIKKMLSSFDEKQKLKEFQFHKIDYVLYIETLKIYVEKCLKLCELIEKLADKIKLDKETCEFLDFTIRDDEVLISDIDRVAIPLMKVYEYALTICVKANNPSTYLNRVIQPGVSYNLMLPSQELLGDSVLNPNEFIALTDKQKQEKFLKEL